MEMTMDRYSDPRVLIDDLISDGVEPNAEALISALLDDEMNDVVYAALQIVRDEY